MKDCIIIKPHRVVLLYIAVLFYILLTSCGYKRIIPTISNTRIDTVVINNNEVRETVIRDTVIKINEVVSEVHDTIKDCSELLQKKNVVENKKNGLTAKLTINNGVINAQCHSDSFNLIIRNLQNSIIRKNNELREKKVEVKEVAVEQVKLIPYTRVPRWCWLLLMVNVAYVLWRNKNFIIKKIIK